MRHARARVFNVSRVFLYTVILTQLFCNVSRHVCYADEHRVNKYRFFNVCLVPLSVIAPT